MTNKPKMALKMRSWLFAPGDSERKMTKAMESSADIALFDLEDAVTPENKPLARQMVHDFLKAHTAYRARLWVRINPFDGPYTLADLAAIMPAHPGGIMLPKVYGRADVEKLDHCLSALEVANGIEEGSTPVIVLITETAEAMFHTGSYKGAPRVVALTWGAEDLADSIGASSNRNPDGSYSFTYELARSLTVLGAATAGVAAVETISADFKDLDALRARAEKVRRATDFAGCSRFIRHRSMSSMPPLPPAQKTLPKPARLLRFSMPIPALAPSAIRVACSTGPFCRAHKACSRRSTRRDTQHRCSGA